MEANRTEYDGEGNFYKANQPQNKPKPKKSKKGFGTL